MRMRLCTACESTPEAATVIRMKPVASSSAPLTGINSIALADLYVEEFRSEPEVDAFAAVLVNRPVSPDDPDSFPGRAINWYDIGKLEIGG